MDELYVVFVVPLRSSVGEIWGMGKGMSPTKTNHAGGGIEIEGEEMRERGESKFSTPSPFLFYFVETHFIRSLSQRRSVFVSLILICVSRLAPESSLVHRVIRGV
jgi:hypothetical protein